MELLTKGSRSATRRQLAGRFGPDQPVRSSILPAKCWKRKKNVPNTAERENRKVECSGFFKYVTFGWQPRAFRIAWYWWSRNGQDRDLGRTRAPACPINHKEALSGALVGNLQLYIDLALVPLGQSDRSARRRQVFHTRTRDSGYEDPELLPREGGASS